MGTTAKNILASLGSTLLVSVGAFIVEYAHQEKAADMWYLIPVPLAGALLAWLVPSRFGLGAILTWRAVVGIAAGLFVGAGYAVVAKETDLRIHAPGYAILFGGLFVFFADTRFGRD